MSKYTIGPNGRYSVPLVDFGHRLQDNFGLKVVEHPAFGPVTNVHVDGSHHYSDNAIDIQDWRADTLGGVHWRDRTKNLYHMLKGAGPEVLGPGVKDHDSHVHLAAYDGNLHLTPSQYNYFFGGKSGGKLATFNSNLMVAPALDEYPNGNPMPVGSRGQVDSEIQAELNGIDSKVQAKVRAETKEKAEQWRARTASDVVEGFGNNYGEMESQDLANHLKATQESIIQKRMDAGESFGMMKVTDS